MWRNYLTTGVRALLKNRTYAVITVAGLALGLAACMLILLFVRDQWSYDRFVPDADRVYQLQQTFTDPQTGRQASQQATPYAMGPALAQDFPQVEYASYMFNWQPILLVRGEPQQQTITLVGKDFFRIFALPFVRGSAAGALRDANSIVVSARQAETLFRSTDVIGRTITVLTRDGQRAYRVSGVFADLPKNAHNRPSMIALHTPDRLSPGEADSWNWNNGYNYFKLRAGADVAAIDGQLRAWSLRRAPKDTVDGKLVSDVENAAFRLTALPDIHLGKAKYGPAGNDGDRGTVVTFAVLAILILVMACINFTNLATARASQRAREVALRKVLGASRRQLVVQFLTESLIVAALATLLGLGLVELSLPWLRQFLNAGIPLAYVGSQGILLPAILLTMLVGLVGGLYPAFYLTRFQPAQVLKANKSAADTAGSGRLRNVLVVGQFAISIGLIVCTAVVYAQTRHVRDTDPGFVREGLVQVDNAGRSRVVASIAALEQEIGRVPGVRSVALTQIAMNTPSRINSGVIIPGRPSTDLGTYRVGYGFFETMGMRMVAGRSLSRSYALDDASTPVPTTDAGEQALMARGMNIVINVAASRQLGFATPAAAVGKQVGLTIAQVPPNAVPATIVGVVADTRFRGYREPIDPVAYYHTDAGLGFMVVRFADRDPAALMQRIGAAWKQVIPTVPFQAQFSDDAAAELYRDDQALGTMFAAFSLLAVVIGCLGLFGLAAFTAERRTKEIGIRKVLGAKTRDIVRLLVWQFSKPVLIANVIAWPLAYLAMRYWLTGFDDRIALTPLPFIAAGSIALLIAIVTVASHAIRIAAANPIHALRYE